MSPAAGRDDPNPEPFGSEWRKPFESIVLMYNSSVSFVVSALQSAPSIFRQKLTAR